MWDYAEYNETWERELVVSFSAVVTNGSIVNNASCSSSPSEPLSIMTTSIVFYCNANSSINCAFLHSDLIYWAVLG